MQRKMVQRKREMDEIRPLYRDYAQYLKEKYKEKVYKLPVNIAGTCPNRDGTIGSGGCIFCDEQGAGFEALSVELSVAEQLERNKGFFSERFNAGKFIAYFQAYTNTYLPLEDFKNNILQACSLKDLVGISVSTRPDCLDDEYLSFLKEISIGKGIDIQIELGLQTANYHTLKKINRGHGLAEYIDSVMRIRGYAFEICTHLILNLPWDDRTDVVESARIISVLGVDSVKLHSLYIVRDTILGDMYERGEIKLISLEEYIDRVILFLENLNEDIIIQRLVGKGPQGNMLFCNWDTSWWKIKSMIEEKMRAQKTYQGKCRYKDGFRKTK